MKQRRLIYFVFLWLLLSSCTANQEKGSKIDESPLLLTVSLSPVPVESPGSTMPTATVIPIVSTSSIEATGGNQPVPSPSPMLGQLVVLSEPDGAILTIMDVNVTSQTPYSTTLSPGNYILELNLDGYETWESTINIVAGETTMVQVPLTAYEYIKIEELDSTHYLTYLSWTPNGQSLIYAIQNTGVSSEGKDWIWWQFNLHTGEKTLLQAPQSQVNELTRKELNLCPLQNDDIIDHSPCPEFSILMESSVSDHMIFSPLTSGDGETWLSSKDGSNPVKLEGILGPPAYVDWSENGHWLIIGVYSHGLPGQRLYYLASTDGSFVQRLDQLTKQYSLQISGLFPKFSPNSQKLAYIGAQDPETSAQSDYKLYSLDLNTFESQLVSERFGPFQWEETSNGLYILDNGAFPMSTSTTGLNPRLSTLYYVDLVQRGETPIATNILYYPKNSSSAWLWAYSPNLQAIAYVGLQANEELGVLLLDSTE